VSGRFAVDTLRGSVVIEFGFNRWVLVSVGSDRDQKQVDSRSELAAFLRERGLSEREANELSEEAWKERPRDAAEHVATSRDSLVAATGLSTGTVLLIVVAFVVAFASIAIYVLSRPR
jgi:hypothetical protein